MATDATPILQTPRLELRAAASSDRSFFLQLLNDPAWLENIGDRGIRSEADAEGYIRSSIWAQYDAFGYGMYLVQLKGTMLPVGICGLVKRDFLGAPDLGFALLPEHVGHGYADEATRGLIAHAKSRWAIGQLYAIVKAANERSVRLLQRLGFEYERPYVLPQGGNIELYVRFGETAESS